jgi:type I restriction enzyme S subunit
VTEELPRGWCEGTLGDVADYINGAAFKPEDWQGDGVPIIRIQNLTDSNKPLNRTKRQVDPRLLIRRGNLLFSWSATLDAFIWDREDAWLNQHIFKVVPRRGVIDRSFLYHLLRHEVAALLDSEHLHGSTMRHINRGPLLGHRIGLPPLAEQRRIVARIEALFARTRQARADLLRVAPLATHFNAALIARTVCGGAVASASMNGPATPAVDPDLAGTWLVPELPRGWTWRPFEDLFDDVTSSQNKLQQRAYQASGRFPVIDQGEGQIGGWSDDARLAYRGTLPVIVFGDHTRAIKFVDQSFIQGADGVKVLAPRPGAYHPRFGYWALRGLSLPDKGYSRHMKFLRASQFPVPPLDVQATLARSLDDAMQASITARGDATRALALLDHLERSILTRAFRGELVPQDAADEPAVDALTEMKGSIAGAPTRRRATAPAARLMAE